MIAAAPMPQEMIAAGPAVCSAPCAPNSQPEPMIEPVDAHSRAMNPISRFSPFRLVTGGEPISTAAAWVMDPACDRTGCGQVGIVLVVAQVVHRRQVQAR